MAISEWLHNRKQRLQDVFSGVPHGSVLGPTPFLIFPNDIDTVMFSHIQKFADDYKVCRSVPSATDITTLQQDISDLCQMAHGLANGI